MKFGRLLRTTAEDLPEMESLFRSYKQLKKQLKRLPYRQMGPAEGCQQQPLDHEPSEAAKAAAVGGSTGTGTAGPSSAACSPRGGRPSAAVTAAAATQLTDEENAFLQALSTALAQMNEVFLEKEESSVIQVQRLEEELEALTAAGAATDGGDAHTAAMAALHKCFVNSHGEVVLLVHWSILAYTATVKILKKHHKRTGLLLRAPQLGDLLSQPFCSTELMTSIAHRLDQGLQRLSRQMGIATTPLCAGTAATATTRAAAAGIPASGAGAAAASSSAGAAAAAPRVALRDEALDAALLQRLTASEPSAAHSSGAGCSSGTDGAASASSGDSEGSRSGSPPSAARRRARSPARPGSVDACDSDAAKRMCACRSAGTASPPPAGAASSACCDRSSVPEAACQCMLAPRTGSMLRATQVALTTWEHLKSSASTPSTAIAQPQVAAGVRGPHTSPAMSQSSSA